MREVDDPSLDEGSPIIDLDLDFLPIVRPVYLDHGPERQCAMRGSEFLHVVYLAAGRWSAIKGDPVPAGNTGKRVLNRLGGLGFAAGRRQKEDGASGPQYRSRHELFPSQLFPSPFEPTQPPVRRSVYIANHGQDFPKFFEPAFQGK